MTKDSSIGLWNALLTVECSVAPKIAEMLEPFQRPVTDCYECGVEVPTLSCKNSKTKDLLISALFLKHSLNDLRAVWNLLLLGYTSQAGSVAAAAFENALTAACVAGDINRVDKLLNSKSSSSPWSVVDLCKMQARRRQEEAKLSGEAFSEKEFNIAWMELYGVYKWLCQLKHPTLSSAMHDASSTSLQSNAYVVTALPDIRPEDLPNKATILSITLSRIHAAICSFAFGMDIDYEDPRVIVWTKRLNSIVPNSVEAYELAMKTPLPFDLKSSKFAREYTNLRQSK